MRTPASSLINPTLSNPTRILTPSPLHLETSMPLSMEQKEKLLDDLIVEYGHDNFVYSLRDAPETKMKSDQDQPLGIEDLPVRPLPAKTVVHMFDMHKGVPGASTRGALAARCAMVPGTRFQRQSGPERPCRRELSCNGSSSARRATP